MIPAAIGAMSLWYGTYDLSLRASKFVLGVQDQYVAHLQTAELLIISAWPTAAASFPVCV